MCFREFSTFVISSISATKIPIRPLVHMSYDPQSPNKAMEVQIKHNNWGGTFWWLMDSGSPTSERPPKKVFLRWDFLRVIDEYFIFRDISDENDDDDDDDDGVMMTMKKCKAIRSTISWVTHPLGPFWSKGSWRPLSTQQSCKKNRHFFLPTKANRICKYCKSLCL